MERKSTVVEKGERETNKSKAAPLDSFHVAEEVTNCSRTNAKPRGKNIKKTSSISRTLNEGKSIALLHSRKTSVEVGPLIATADADSCKLA